MSYCPYKILGVTKFASISEVKKAYRKKARENHPDLNPSDTQAKERMNVINEAYDRIINPQNYAGAGANSSYASAQSVQETERGKIYQRAAAVEFVVKVICGVACISAAFLGKSYRRNTTQQR